MTKPKYTVAVVLSAYNGSRYIQQQIDSVLNQSFTDLYLFIRDDGSSDETRHIISSNASDRCGYEFGDNVGVARSFYLAARDLPVEYDYLAFCDQDDFWLPDKIARSVEIIKTLPPAQPNLYCSEYYYCDENLSNSSMSSLNYKGYDFVHSLFESKVSGNTIVANKTLASLYLMSGFEDVGWHDWWLSQIAFSVGNVYFDSNPSLLYRRIDSSVSPTGNNCISLLMYRFQYFVRSNKFSLIKRQINKLYVLFGAKMSTSDRKLADLFTNGSRIKKAVYPGRLRQHFSDELIVRILFLIGVL